MDRKMPQSEEEAGNKLYFGRPSGNGGTENLKTNPKGVPMKVVSCIKIFSLMAGMALLVPEAHADNRRAVPVPLPGGDFESNNAAWPLTPEYQIGRWGRNNTKGLKCERHAPGYKIMARPLKLKHGHSYRLSWWMKIEGELPGGGAAVSVDWYNGGTWNSFTMLRRTRSTNNEWQHCVGEFTAPSNPDFTFMLLAYLRNDTIGRVFFDDFKLEEIIGEISCYPVNMSNGRVVKKTPLEMAFLVSGDGSLNGKAVYSLSDASGKVLFNGASPIRSNRISIDMNQVPTASYTLTVAWANPQTGRNEPEFQYPVTVVDENAGTVHIDRIGRCIVNGKTFMPVGWFAAGVNRKMRLTDLDIGLDVLKDSPFNTIVPYNGLRFDDSQKDEIEAAKEVLDACAEANQMVIYSLKHLYPASKLSRDGRTYDRIVEDTVNGIKDHPALLAWYTTDEPPKNKIPELRARHRMINRLDPDHPTWGVFSSYADLPFFGGNYDVLGIDPYPYNGVKDFGHNSVCTALQDARNHNLRTNGELALWVVAQAHNIGLYYGGKITSEAEFFANTRIPTEEEARAMVVMEAIGGAKGFFFYSEFDLRKWPESKRYAERWAVFCRVGRLLRNLEPYIMASAPRLKVKVRNVKGIVAACAMRSDAGAVALLISTTSRGEHEATISEKLLPAGLVSLYGLTREESPGVYRFTGKNADCDVLFEAAHMPGK